MNEPITPADRVLPTEADVADALIQHETSGMCRYRRTCGTCDCGRSSLNAKGLAEQDAMELGRARAVLALFASQPTVAQVKTEALREAAQEFWARLPDGTGNGRMYNSYRVASFGEVVHDCGSRHNRLDRRFDNGGPVDRGHRSALALDAVGAVLEHSLHARNGNPRYGCCATPKVCTDPHQAVCGAPEHGTNKPHWPCPTVRLLDQIESDAKGDER